MGAQFSHATLYNYCHELYCQKIAELSADKLHPAIARSPANKLFYWYPATTSPLLNLYPSSDTLSSKGWFPGFVNSPFILWYRKDQSVQCIPVDLKSGQMIKNNSLNTDYPFSFKWVRRVSQSQHKSDTPIYVCADPVIAALMIDRGELAVAMGGDFLPHAHEKHLASLNRPLIYLGTKSKKDAPAKFVTTMHRYNCEAHVTLVDDLHELLTQPDVNFTEVLQQAKTNGDHYVINRIANKRRVSNGLTVAEEYSQLLSDAPHDVQCRYKALIDGLGLKLENVNYANGCELFASLLRANMKISDARDVVTERYGIKINISS